MLRSRRRHFHAAFIVAALAGSPAWALDTKVIGRLGFGASFRTEASAPDLLVPYNAAAVGLTGVASAGQNSDDANLNFRRGDAVSRALKGYVDLEAGEGGLRALVRIKAWHDFALSDHARPWGNSINGYAAGQPLDDAGAARLSRFSGVALGDVFVQHSAQYDGLRTLVRLGQQSLSWGERGGFPGGLSAINAVDLPARRCGAAGIHGSRAHAGRARRVACGAGGGRLLPDAFPANGDGFVRYLLGHYRLRRARLRSGLRRPDACQ